MESTLSTLLTEGSIILSDATNTTHSSTTSHAEGGHQGSGIEDSLLFVILCVFIGALVKSYMASHLVPEALKPPYTLNLFLIGFFLGTFAHMEGFFFEAFAAAERTDPHLILFLLLPPLLYESAVGIRFHVLWRVKEQVVILASVGVIISIFLVTLFVKLTFVTYSHWDLSQVLLMASILCATDPVAVVAALKELGAPATLSTLIEGESLLNDGSAFVLFLVFKDLAGGKEFEFFPVLGQFLQLVLGGIAFGVLMSVLVFFWLKIIYNHPLIEIPVILMGVYATFYVAEDLLHVSGVLATVMFGFMMSNRFKYTLSPAVMEMNEAVWTQLAHVSESIIFIMGGVIVHDKIINSDISGDYRHWLWLILLYILLNVVRASMVTILQPLLVRLGYGFSFKQGAVLTYGGLRGAVSLILGLIVEADPLVDPDVRALINFHVAGIVFGTLFINGWTTPFIYNWLRLYPPDRFQRAILRKTIEYLEEYASHEWADLKSEWYYSGADWDKVQAIVPDFRNIQLSKTSPAFTMHPPSISKIYSEYAPSVPFSRDYKKPFRHNAVINATGPHDEETGRGGGGGSGAGGPVNNGSAMSVQSASSSSGSSRSSSTSSTTSTSSSHTVVEHTPVKAANKKSRTSGGGKKNGKNKGKNKGKGKGKGKTSGSRREQLASRPQRTGSGVYSPVAAGIASSSARSLDIPIMSKKGAAAGGDILGHALEDMMDGEEEVDEQEEEPTSFESDYGSYGSGYPPYPYGTGSYSYSAYSYSGGGVWPPYVIPKMDPSGDIVGSLPADRRPYGNGGGGGGGMTLGGSGAGGARGEDHDGTMGPGLVGVAGRGMVAEEGGPGGVDPRVRFPEIARTMSTRQLAEDRIKVPHSTATISSHSLRFREATHGAARSGMSSHDRAKYEAQLYHTYFNATRSHYEHQFEEGIIGDAAMHKLLEAVDRAAECRDEKNQGDSNFADIHPALEEWKYIMSTLRLPTWLITLSKIPMGWVLSHFMLYNFVWNRLEMLHGYVRAHEYITPHFPPDIAGEFSEIMLVARTEIREFTDRYEDIATVIQTMMAARILLQYKREKIKELGFAGAFTSRDTEQLLHVIDQQVDNLVGYHPWPHHVPAASGSEDASATHVAAPVAKTPKRLAPGVTRQAIVRVDSSADSYNDSGSSDNNAGVAGADVGRRLPRGYSSSTLGVPGGSDASKSRLRAMPSMDLNRSSGTFVQGVMYSSGLSVPRVQSSSTLPRGRVPPALEEEEPRWSKISAGEADLFDSPSGGGEVGGGGFLDSDDEVDEDGRYESCLSSSDILISSQ